jgi:RNA polymerase sigma-70 factor (ECF subfamily)
MTGAGSVDDLVALRPWLVGHLRRRLRDSADAEDLAQEVMIRALGGLVQFGGRCDLRTWLFRIANRLASNYCRDRQTSRRYEAEACLGWSEASPEGWRDDNQIASKQVLLGTLARLSDGNRAILAMHYHDGLSVDQISDKLGVGRSATKMRLLRARQEFQRTHHAREVELSMAA